MVLRTVQNQPYSLKEEVLKPIIPFSKPAYETSEKIPTALTQLAAEQQCNTLGAHLASFETASEANAVKKLVLEAPLFSSELLSFMTTSQESWIGLAKETNGAWTWTDSSSVEFTNLPDGTSAPESSCVYMNTTGHWQPKSCSSTTPSFICKQTSRIAS
uniref:C-type lectin domain-containing protein n=1 Tax=Caenorhabditis japonica TaxID=281687 RepID=A0A8R1IBC7_CAEJA